MLLILKLNTISDYIDYKHISELHINKVRMVISSCLNNMVYIKPAFLKDKRCCSVITNTFVMWWTKNTIKDMNMSPPLPIFLFLYRHQLGCTH